MKIASKIRSFLTRNVGIDPWYFLFRPNNVATGEFLTEEDALKVSTVYRCVSLLSQGVATLPCILYDNNEDGGKTRSIKHPYFNLFLFKPNHFQDSVNFFEQVMISLCFRGNAYIQKVMTKGGVASELIPLLPDYVRVKGTSDNLTYEYRQPLDLAARIFNADEIIHIKALPKNGVMGISPIDKIMEAVAMSLASERFGASFFANGVTPSGILEHPASLSEDAYNRLNDSFNKKLSDSTKKHRTLILEEGTKWTQMGITNEQAQFIQTRKFTVEDIGRWFGVPPHLLGVTDRQTGGSIEQLGLEFLTHTLRPWLVRIELAIITQLFDQKDWSKFTLEFLADALLRADTVTRYQSYTTGINNGFLSIDEARAQENKNPLKDNLGKDYYRPLNMYVVGEKPPPQTVTPGAVPTTDGTKGYAPGTPYAQGIVSPDVSDGTARSKILSLQSIIDFTMERIGKRAEKVTSNGKNDWSKFTIDTIRDVKPIFEAGFSIMGQKINPSMVDQLSEIIVSKYRNNQASENWSNEFSSLILDKINGETP